MRRALLPASLAGLAALTALTSPAVAQNGSRAQAAGGWYVGASGGAGRGSTLGQEGWNLDTFCYPDSACFDQDPIPGVPGYRWSYDIGLDTGAGFEVFAGRSFGRARLELAAGAQRNGANQRFTGIAYYDGSPVLPRPGGAVTTSSRASVDNVNIRSIMLNAYYDFPGAWGRATPYVGAGVGLAAVELAGLHFSIDYQDPAGGAYDPPLSFYTSIQNSDVRDTGFRWALHAGADFPAAAGVLLGVRLSYSEAGDAEDTGAYEAHPYHVRDPGFANNTRLSGPRGVTLAVTLKRLIGS